MSLTEFFDFKRRHLVEGVVFKYVKNKECLGKNDKHSCCATPNVHTTTPLGTLSGDFPCSQA
jgi:hypothetical protein